VRGERVERVASTKGQAWAEASSNRGLHSCTNGAWVLLGPLLYLWPARQDPACALIERTAHPGDCFYRTRERTDPARNGYPRIRQSGKTAPLLDLSAGSSAQRHARVQGYRSALGARTVWGPIW
jgi:hypothetical protein